MDELTPDKLNERPDDITENPYIRLIVKRDDRMETSRTQNKENNQKIDDIFGKDHDQMTEEYKTKIENLEENITLHVSGFKE